MAQLTQLCLHVIVKKLPLPFYLLTLLTAFLPLQIHADTVILATGEKVDGKISLETDTEITVEIKVSSSISDERVIKKADIKKIEKDSPEELAFQAVKNFKLNSQSSFKPEVYDRTIARLQNFKTNYPNSTHLDGITEILTAFEQEKTRVDAGELKFQGKWINRAEATKRKVQIGGQQFFDNMKYQSGARDLSGALNSFDEIEKNYKGARIYPDAIELAIQILNTLYRDALERAKINVYNQEQFKKALSMTKPEDVSRLVAAEKREQDLGIAALDESKKNGTKWPPFIPRSSESMNIFLGTIPTELDRLKALPVQKMHTSVSQVDDAQLAFSSGKQTEAVSRLSDALKLWPDNEEATRLKSQIDAIKPEPTPVAAPQPTPPPAAATPAPVVPEEIEKPFYMTPRGALLITLCVIALIGGISKLKGQKDSTPPVNKKAK